MRRIVTACLVLGGAAGLIDEVVWGRGVGVLLGSTAHAHALTLAVFLGGLALGAALFGRLADRVRNPMRLYAALEVGVAATTVLTPAALRWATELFVPLAQRFYPHDGVTVGLLKLAVALALLLPPTLLMGGTLPVVVRALVREGHEVGSKVALLYAANSAGAVVGCLLSGLWLVPAIGLDRCAMFAASLNVLAAALALLVRREPEPAASTSPSNVPVLEPAPPRVVLAAGVAMLLSGFASLLYETLWIRVLSLVLGGTAHAFPLMLAAFITGVTLGAHVAGRRVRTWREAVRALAWVEAGAAACVALAFWAYQYLPYVDLLAAHALGRNADGYRVHLVFSFAVAIAVMAVPASFLGATLPIAAQAAAGDVRALGRRLGDIYAWNTLGNVLGAVVGGLWAMSWWGLQGAFVVGGLLNALAGLVPLVASREGARRTAAPALAVGAAMLLLALTPFDASLLSRGTFRARGVDPGSYDQFAKKLLDGSEVLFREDGASATVEVHRYDGDILTLRLNGKADASTAGDMQTQLLLGHLPMLLHEGEPKKVLVIGFGSGVTVAAVRRHAPDAEVTVVELSPEVLRAARYFHEVNDGVYDDPKVRVVLDDARTFVRLTRERFDVVIAEPSNPWMSGISGLFTRAFFGELSQVLAPGGVLLQWCQFYETTDDIVRMVVRTFRTRFPDATAWGAAGADMLLLSGVDPARIDWTRVRERASRQAVAESLRRARIDDIAALAAMQMYSADGLAAYAGDGDVHTDEWPQLEYAGAVALFLGAPAQELIEGDERRGYRPDRLALGSYLKGRELTAFEARAVAQAMEEWMTTGPQLPVSALRRAAEADPAEWGALERVLSDRFAFLPASLDRDFSAAEGHAERLASMARDKTQAELDQSSVFRRPRLRPAIEAMQEALSLGLSDTGAAWRRLARWQAIEGDAQAARMALEHARAAEDADKVSADVWSQLEVEISQCE